MIADVQRLAPEIIGRSLKTPADELRKALDAEHFVAIRKVPGGPAPETVAAELSGVQDEMTKMRAWVESKTRLQGDYKQRIHDAASALTGQGRGK
jgi:argininosuccinate lyase